MLEGSTMDALQKPELAAHAGAWVDPDFLTEALKAMLLDHLKAGGITGDDAVEYLATANRFAQYVDEARPATTAAAIKASLEELATKARALQQAMGPSKLSGAALERLDAVVDQAQRQHDLPDWLVQLLARADPQGGLLECAWDVVSTLESACREAASQVEVNQRNRTAESVGAGLVELMLEAFESRFNRLPPKDSRAWFALFMAALGDHLKVTCHAAAVAAAIERRQLRNAVPESSGTA